MSDTAPTAAQVVICGAGIAGVSAAFHLARLGVTDIVVVDDRPPLTLTSDKSTECYRNWWPTKPMVDLMSRSIDLLESYAIESGDRFSLSRRGYLYVTADPDELASMVNAAEAIGNLGAGGVRIHRSASVNGDDDTLDGADVFLTGDALRSRFEYLTPTALGGVHVRRAGWLSAQQLGAWMVEEILASGGVFLQGSVDAVGSDDRGIRWVSVEGVGTITTSTFVNAAGPLAGDVGKLIGVDLPIHSEIHQKVSFKDHKQAFPRQAPMVIWNDPQRLAWDNEVREMLVESGYSDAVGTLPPFVHGRPEGGPGSEWALGLWEWRTRTTENPSWPLPEDPLYPELVMRGLSAMLPAMSVYAEALPHHTVDGGYYTKTIENMPIVGPAGPTGSYVCGALSGYGIMAACAVGELVALHITRGELPPYSSACDLRRYDDPAYVASLATLGATGQI